MSLGVATRDDFEQTGEEIIHNADTALYHSKVKGRNLVFAHTQLSPQISVPQPVLEDSNEVDELVAKITNEANEYLTNLQDNILPLTRRRISLRLHNQTPPKHKTVSSTHPATPHASSHKVYMYIALLALVAFSCIRAGIQNLRQRIFLIPAEWIALAALMFMTILTEGLSISLYVGNTSISTTAVPLVASFILFGPFGVIVGSAVYAVTAAIKFRSPINRMIFNFSNHVIAGMLINFMIVASGAFFQDWNIGIQLLYTLASSIIVYFTTTSLISVGMGIDLKQPPFEIWKEQYQWMAPYYIGIGFVSYSLIFGYKYADLLGIVFLAVPLLLLRFSQVQYVGHTRNIVSALRKKNVELEKSANEINELNEGLLATLSEIIDVRDPYVLGHSKQVSVYATEIAKVLNINQKQIDLVRKAGLLHDIGKLGIPMDLLTKPSSLTSKEYETIKTHAALGADLVKNTPSLRPIAQIIRHHHEHYNGKGYPDKIAGNQISIEARIVAVADAIEAMSSDRTYRRALKPDRVKKELIEHSGTQFDPLVVDAAIKALDKMQETEVKPATQKDARSNSTSKLATDIQRS